MALRLTARQLNRATLARQMLLKREPLGIVEAVHRVVALQAQEPASPYIALWNRVSRFDPKDLDRAFSEHDIIKATLMRVTLHAVAATDYPDFHLAMQVTLRAARLNDGRFRRTGLTPADAEALMPEVLEFARQPRTNAEAETWLDERLGVTEKPGVWWAFRQYGPIWHPPIGGPWSFGARPSYISARTKPQPEDGAAAMQRLARRYLEGFGPASVQDLAQFSTIYRPPAKEALKALGDDLVRLEGPGGEELFDLPGVGLPPEDSPAPPRLLPMWDSVLLAHADRSRVIPPDYRRRFIHQNGDMLPALLVDGYVAGVWRPVEDGIEATAFHRLTPEAWAGLDEEARALRTLLADREPLVYKRYAHWWTKGITGVEVRILGS